MDKDEVEKCLAFCQALSSSNQLFSFNLKIGSDTFDMKQSTEKREEKEIWKEATKAKVWQVSYGCFIL